MTAAESTARLLNGRAMSDAVVAEVTARVPKFRTATGQVPGLAVILVGENPASEVYVRNKSLRAASCGFHSVQHNLPTETNEHDLLELIKTLNEDPAIHGILLQLPLPPQINSETVLTAVKPFKDVDGFHPYNIGLLGAGMRDKALVPCTPSGCLLLIESVLGTDLSGQRAIILGRSNIVGKPVSQLLLQQNATVTIAHSRTTDLAALCRQSDILVAAIGKPEMVRGDWIKPGAVVIDVGINRLPPLAPGGKARLVGDVATAEAARIASAITPVPGGVGPMTIAMLMANTLVAACLQTGLPRPSFYASSLVT